MWLIGMTFEAIFQVNTSLLLSLKVLHRSGFPLDSYHILLSIVWWVMLFIVVVVCVCR